MTLKQAKNRSPKRRALDSLSALSVKELSAAELQRQLDAIDAMIELRKQHRQPSKRGDLVHKVEVIAAFEREPGMRGLSGKRFLKLAVAKEKLGNSFNTLARRLGIAMAYEVACIGDVGLRESLIKKGLPRGSRRLPLAKARVRQVQLYLLERRTGSRSEHPRRGPGVRWPHSLRTAIPGLLDKEVWGWLEAAFKRVSDANVKTKTPFVEATRKRMKELTRQQLEVLRGRVHELWEKLHDTVESMGRGKKKRSPTS